MTGKISISCCLGHQLGEKFIWFLLLSCNKLTCFSVLYQRQLNLGGTKTYHGKSHAGSTSHKNQRFGQSWIFIWPRSLRMDATPILYVHTNRLTGCMTTGVVNSPLPPGPTNISKQINSSPRYCTSQRRATLKW